MKTASWVIRNKVTGVVVMETFSAAAANAINRDKYEAVPILDYLVSINGAAK
jgi:hypothetical protein